MKNYKEMLMEAKKKGLTSEPKMWDSIVAIEPMLSRMKEEHPDEYEKFIRQQHQTVYGPHYDKELAEDDMEGIEYTDKEGKKHSGAHWTKDEVLNATKDMKFPQGTTDYDKYVAFNAAYADFSKDFSDSDILKIGHRFFFSDEDAPEGKVYKYMNAMKKWQ